MFLALRGVRWKLIYNVEKKTYQFYNLENDPQEKSNLVKGAGIAPYFRDKKIEKKFNLFKDQLHKLAEQAYLLRHKRRAFKKVKIDKETLRLLEGLGYTDKF